MGSGVEVKVIKPPFERVTSGKVFKPSKVFLYKMWVKAVAGLASIWLIVVLGFVSIAYLVAFSDPLKYPSASVIISDWLGPVCYWTIGLNLIWLVPYLVLAPYYFRRIEYSVKGESGETLPEIYVKKGIVTVTRKHVPFRTITKIIYSYKTSIFLITFNPFSIST